MKKLLLLVAFFFTQISAKSLEEIYLQQGFDGIKNKIETNLKSYDFWKNALKDKQLEYGYYSVKTSLIAVNKNLKELHSFEYDDGVLVKKFGKNVITGKDGDKLIEGDLKTPVGVYDITKRFTPPSDYYGPLAYELSYPNLMDKLAKKTGSGIWIHGLPMTGKRTNDYNTRGCVAFENDSLIEFGKIVKDSGVVLITEKEKIDANTDEIAVSLASLFIWKEAWEKNDINGYLKFYADDFMRFDGMGVAAFKQMKTRIFAKNEPKKISFTNISVTPYPNLKGERIYRISFYEDYEAPSYKFKGQKELYAKVENGKFQIIIEE